MGKMVKYGGAAPVNDNCYGSYNKIYEVMKKVAMVLIYSSPALARAGHEYIQQSDFNDEYEIIIGAFKKIFRIIDDATIELAGRKDTCTDLGDVWMGTFGLKNCKNGNTKIEGFYGLLVNFFKTHFGDSALIRALTANNGILAVYTTMRHFIATLLTKVMCAIYVNGTKGTVGTWVIAKAIIQSIGKVIKEGGILSKNIAIGIGGEILKFVTGLGRWNNKRNEYQIANDATPIKTIESNIREIDNAVAVSHGGVLTGLSDAVDDLENIEYEEEGGDEIIQDYITNDEQMASDFSENDDKLNFMRDYLLEAIQDTEDGGEEYNEHHELLSMIKQLSGRWRPATHMYDMGDPSLIPASQPMGETDYDSELDAQDYMNQTFERTRSYGGIIKKEDSKFIKNLNKSMKKMRKRLKSNKAGYNYIKKNKGTKKFRRHRNINPGFSKKKAGKKTRALGKGIKTKRRKIRRGRG